MNPQAKRLLDGQREGLARLEAELDTLARENEELHKRLEESRAGAQTTAHSADQAPLDHYNAAAASLQQHGDEKLNAFLKAALDNLNWMQNQLDAGRNANCGALTAEITALRARVIQYVKESRAAAEAQYAAAEREATATLARAPVPTAQQPATPPQPVAGGFVPPTPSAQPAGPAPSAPQPPFGQQVPPAPAQQGSPAAFTPPQPTQAQKPAKPKREIQVGGLITGIVGLLFILIGVVLGLRYTFAYLLQSDWLKLALAYLLGALFVGAGEIVIHKKGRNGFFTSLLAGGVGIWLATTAAGYFNLRAIPALAACGLCVATAGIAALLAIRHKSQLIAIFALAGGYMPILAVDSNLTTPAKIYLLLLNLLVLLLSIQKDWRVLKCISLGANTLALLYLYAIQAFTGWGQFTVALAWDVGYLLLCFLVYTAVCMLFSVRKAKPLAGFDITLLAVNTWVHFLLVQFVLALRGVPRSGGIVALVLCAGFWLAARACRKWLPGDKAIRALFYANSYALLPLGIALFFRGDAQLYALLGAGAALWCTGITIQNKWYWRGGAALFGLGALRFILIHLPYLPTAYPGTAGALPFSVLVVLATGILVCQLYRVRQPVAALAGSAKGFWLAYQTALIAVVYLYLAWLQNLALLHLCYAREGMAAHYRTWSSFITLLLALALPLLLPRLAILQARATTALSVVFALGGIVFSVAATGLERVLGRGDTPSVLLLLAINLLAVYNLFALLGKLPQTHVLRAKWRTVLTIALGLLLSSQWVLVQFRQSFFGMAISVLYLAAALGCIWWGFVKPQTILRRFGLAVLYVAVTKLFLLDLAYLPTGERILSYFVFGFAMLGISWGYQHYEKLLATETDGKDKPD